MTTRRFFTIFLFASLLSVAWMGHTTRTTFAERPLNTPRQDFPPVPGGTPIVVGLPNLNPPRATPIPAGHTAGAGKLTPSKAVRIAVNNTYVRGLLHGTAYRISRIVFWAAGPGSTIILGMYHPVTLTGRWPVRGKAAYWATYRRVTSVRIYVVSRRGIVAAIVPYPLIRG